MPMTMNTMQQYQRIRQWFTCTSTWRFVGTQLGRESRRTDAIAAATSDSGASNQPNSTRIVLSFGAGSVAVDAIDHRIDDGLFRGAASRTSAPSGSLSAWIPSSQCSTSSEPSSSSGRWPFCQ